MDKKRTKSKRIIMKALIGLLCCTLMCAVASIACIAHIISTADRINTEDIYSQIYCTSSAYPVNTRIIKVEDIPHNMKDAVVAIEDKTFYKHHGFNTKRMIGAVFEKVIGESDSISGTSTITQQLARNVYLSDIRSERSIRRKVTEMYYAWQLEHNLTKDEILEAYLNTIYFGYGYYGIDAAANGYFSSSVSDLTLTQCAALAALPAAPDAYALIKDEDGEHCTKIEGTDLYANDITRNRRELVLDLMAEQGYISQNNADDAKVTIDTVIKPNK